MFWFLLSHVYPKSRTGGFLCGWEVEYIWFAWPGFGSGSGSTGVASVRSCQKLSLSLTEPMPVGSMMNPSLSKAKPIGDGRGTSAIKYCHSLRNIFLGFVLPLKHSKPCATRSLPPTHPPAAVGWREELEAQKIKITD